MHSGATKRYAAFPGSGFQASVSVGALSYMRGSGCVFLVNVSNISPGDGAAAACALGRPRCCNANGTSVARQGGKARSVRVELLRACGGLVDRASTRDPRAARFKQALCFSPFLCGVLVLLALRQRGRNFQASASRTTSSSASPCPCSTALRSFVIGATLLV